MVKCHLRMSLLIGSTLMANENPPLIWIDCEMTGLSLETDALVEIAVLVTDENLNVLGDGVDLVIPVCAQVCSKTARMLASSKT